MRRIAISFAGFLLLAALPARAQQMLPRSFDGWNATDQGPSSAATPATSPAVQVPQEVLAEYGWISSEPASYPLGKDAASGELSATVYRMKDPSGAYGLYTYLRTPDMLPAKITSYSLVSDQQALILTGNLLLDVRGKDLRKDTAALKSLARSVGAHAEEGALPTLWETLPSAKMIQGSDRYILGPQTLNQLFPVPVGGSVGFSSGAEAELARYRVGQTEATLLLVDLPTPQIATQILSQLAGKFDVNGSNPSAGTPPLYAKRLLTTLVIVTGPPTKAEAGAFLDTVQSREVLTWNEPSFQVTQPGIGTIVVGTIIGTGVICGFTLVASLAFGGFRLAVKRFFPGRFFDRQKEMQVLQLGLSSKPINANDFYDRSGPAAQSVTVDKNLPDRVALRLFR
jgi:Family of unknown function (DUF6599)